MDTLFFIFCLLIAFNVGFLTGVIAQSSEDIKFIKDLFDIIKDC